MIEYFKDCYRRGTPGLATRAAWKAEYKRRINSDEVIDPVMTGAISRALAALNSC